MFLGFSYILYVLKNGNSFGITTYTLPDKIYTRRMKTSFQKIQKGTSHYISIVHLTLLNIFSKNAEMFFQCKQYEGFI